LIWKSSIKRNIILRVFSVLPIWVNETLYFILNRDVVASAKVNISLHQKKNAGFEVLTAVVMKNFAFWDITTCSPLNINQRFVGICRLHLHG
jgi:hypothetical protein